MPTRTTPLATVRYAGPEYEGRVELLGVQADFQFEPPELQGARGGGASRWPTYTNVEWLPTMRCIRPVGIPEAADMKIDGDHWRIYPGTDDAGTYASPYWRTTKPSLIASRLAFLDFFDTRPDQWGYVYTANPVYPNTAAYILRQSPPANSSTDQYIAFGFLGDPHNAEQSSFAFHFPLGTDAKPYLKRSLTSDNANSEVVAVWEDGVPVNNLPLYEEIFFEVVDDYWYIRRSGVEEPFIYKPEGGATEMPIGPLALRVYGQSAMVWWGQLEYGTGSARSPVVPDPDPGFVSTSRTWAYYPTGTDIPLPDPTWTIEATEEAVTGGFRAVCNITQGNDKHKPPPVWVTSYHAPATHAAASGAITTLDHDNGYWVDSVSYDIDYFGRGQTCDIAIQDRPNTLPFKGNERFVVDVGWNRDAGGAQTAQKFLGYLEDYPRAGDALIDKQGTMLNLRIGDPISARLSKKYMVNRRAAGMWELAVWMYQTLYDAGVPNGQLTDIYALIDTDTPIIPMGDPKGDLRYKYAAETCVIDAADEICEACGWEWGYDCETGLYFLRPYLNTDPAVITPDYTLWDIVSTADDFQFEFIHEKSNEDFRNMLFVASEGLSESDGTIYQDYLSRSLASATNYIGDDWWDVLVAGDSPHVDAVVQKRLNTLLKTNSMIRWTMNGNLDLGPGDFVSVIMDGFGIADATLYQVIHEHGFVRWGYDQPQFKQTFTAREWRIWEAT